MEEDYSTADLLMCKTKIWTNLILQTHAQLEEMTLNEMKTYFIVLILCIQSERKKGLIKEKVSLNMNLIIVQLPYILFSCNLKSLSNKVMGETCNLIFHLSHLVRNIDIPEILWSASN